MMSFKSNVLGFQWEFRLEVTATCVFVLQTLTDWGDGSQDSADASDAGGARPKVMQHTRNTTQDFIPLSWHTKSFSLLQDLADASGKPRRGSSYHEGRSRMEGKNEFFSESTALMSSWSRILNPKLSCRSCRSFGFSNFSPRRSVKASSTRIAGWPPCQTSCSTSGRAKNWWTTDSASCATSERCRIGFYHSSFMWNFSQFSL